MRAFVSCILQYIRGGSRHINSLLVTLDLSSTVKMITRIRRSWLITLILIPIVFFLVEAITFIPTANSGDLSSTPPTPWYQRFNPAAFLPGSFKTPLHPADYLIQRQDDVYCEAMYGPAYLQHIADNHIPYCEAGSQSDMECFVTHIHDPLCVARGVAFRADPGDGNKKWAMDCQYRNFTVEKMEDKTGTKTVELEKFQNVEDIHEYFYWTGVRMELDQWTVGTGSQTPPLMSDVGRDGKGKGTCDKNHNDGKITLLVKREMNHNVWHKFMELWQAMITLDALEMTTWKPPSRHPDVGKQPFLTPEMRKKVQVVFEDNDVGPVDSLWSLVTGSPPIRQDQLNDTCLGTVILPLPGSSSPFWDSHWQDRDCKTKFMLDPFLRRIYKILGINAKNRLTEGTVVTIVDRRHGTRQIHNLASHVAHLAQLYPSVTFNVVDFATIPLKEQIEVARGTDVLVGAMGAGMTHILFMPDEGSVAELMTPGTHYSGFRNLSKMRGLGYFTAHGLTMDEWEALQAKQKTEANKGENQGAGHQEQHQEHQDHHAEHNSEPHRLARHDQPAEGHKDRSAQVSDQQSDSSSSNVSEQQSQHQNQKRHWQDDKYLYFTEELFTSLVSAAINSQLNRGLRSEDVMPVCK